MKSNSQYKCITVEGEDDTNESGNTNPATIISESVANNINIYTFANTIVVENATEEIGIYNSMGRMVAKATANSSRIEIPMWVQGIYVVRVGSIAKRVAVN